MSLDANQANELSGYLSNITQNTELEALALVSREGMRLAFSAIPEYEIDPDQLCALGAVLLRNGEESVDKIGFNQIRIPKVIKLIRTFPMKSAIKAIVLAKS